MTASPFEIEIPRGRVIEVQRDDTRVRRGVGLLRGMAVIWKHWKESFKLNRSYSQIHGTFTIEYPEERPRIPEAYRNMPILLYDDETGHELCTSCFQCERICPPQVIHMTQAKDAATGKPVPAVAEFIIEYDACMSCGFCAEVCPFDAIKMDHEFELSTDDHARLTVHKEQLLRPISYYAKIAPTMWAEVRESALKKLQGNIRRRPDVIGLAPQLTEKIAARRAELAAQAVQAAQAAAAAPAAPAAAPTEGRKLTPEEKAAKLAAIRAAKAAQAGESATPAEAAPAPPSPAPAGEAAPPADKAAKLAAIRAANAAKKAAAGETPATPADGTAADTPADAPPAAPPADKAAKLAAIRAANAAKKAAAGEAPATPPTAPADGTAADTPPAAPPTDKAARLAAIRAANAAKKQQSGDDS
ncbi:MAG: 4Fe-4S dicluster domain-containing protein [Chloroflexus sp.]